MSFQKEVNWLEAGKIALETLENLGGVFLVSQNKENLRPNVMTIGWLELGIVWGRPVITVLVRPSRYTFSLLEKNPFFVMSVPPLSWKKEIDFCGSTSGREVDKFSRWGFNPVNIGNFPVPAIGECEVALGCEIIQKTRVEAGSFSASILNRFYPQDDYHFIYFGEIKESWSKG
ncbi:MAG TPA: flavin reductase [Candidatus Atribacteria bacterium]|nr:flavin reductase [Candidatus Atribacteria bacterium]